MNHFPTTTLCFALAGLRHLGKMGIPKPEHDLCWIWFSLLADIVHLGEVILDLSLNPCI